MWPLHVARTFGRLSQNVARGGAHGESAYLRGVQVAPLATALGPLNANRTFERLSQNVARGGATS